MTKTKWYEKNYRRNLVDMHIDDWDERFLSQFDPVRYVELLKTARVQSAMIYANSHVGYCYWPVRTGKMHRAVKEKDILGSIIDLCHKGKIDVVIYYSVIYNNWAYQNNSSWRIVDVEGKASRERDGNDTFSGRYGLCCPNNNDYRNFVVLQMKELCENYDFEGMFFDMTFWPAVCYCSSCRMRFAEEVGGRIPDTINWEEPNWIVFQKKREEWMSEFAGFISSTVKSFKSGVTVSNQFSPVLHPWLFGTTEGVVDACDFACGDFYGGFLQQTLICKLFYNMTKNMPFEYMTSRCDPNLFDHTSIKSKEMLELHAAIAMAHNGSFYFIDAIDPIGTMNPKVYDTMGEIFDKTRLYEPYLGGKMCQDVGIYFSLQSKYSFSDNGKKPVKPAQLDFSQNGGQGNANNVEPHLEATLGAVRTLKENHIPFGIITRYKIRSLSEYRVVILPNVLKLDEDEAEAIKIYVANGGSLYASGCASPHLLQDIFGINYEGITKETVTYIAPTPRGRYLMPEIGEMYPLAIFGPQIKARALNSDEAMGTVMLPYTDPSDATRFASIHSNPPGINTDFVSIISRSFGKGRVIWTSAFLETVNKDQHKNVFLRLVNMLAIERFSFEADAPGAVELIVFQQSDKKRYLINLINEQEKLPPIAVSGLKVRIRMNGKKACKALSLPDKIPLDMEITGAYAEITVPTLSIFEMLMLEYE